MQTVRLATLRHAIAAAVRTDALQSAISALTFAVEWLAASHDSQRDRCRFAVQQLADLDLAGLPAAVRERLRTVRACVGADTTLAHHTRRDLACLASTIFGAFIVATELRVLRARRAA